MGDDPGQAAARGWPSLDDLGRLLLATLAGALVFGVLAGLTVTLHPRRHLLAHRVRRGRLARGRGADAGAARGRRLHEGDDPVGAWRTCSRASLLLAVTLWVFASTNGLPLAFLPLPVLVWGATRLDLRALATQLAVLGVIVVVLTSEGYGPFAIAGQSGAVAPETVGALTQAFLVTAAVTGLALAVASTQRRDALADLFSEATFTQTVLNSAAATAIIGTDSSGTITLFNRGATNLLGYQSEDVVGSLNWVELHDAGRGGGPGRRARPVARPTGPGPRARRRPAAARPATGPG